MSGRSALGSLARDWTLYALIGSYLVFWAMLVLVSGNTGLSLPIRLMMFAGGTAPMGTTLWICLRQIPRETRRMIITPSLVMMLGVMITYWLVAIAITLIPGLSEIAQAVALALAAVPCLLAILTFEWVQQLYRPPDPHAPEDRR